MPPSTAQVTPEENGALSGYLPPAFAFDSPRAHLLGLSAAYLPVEAEKRMSIAEECKKISKELSGVAEQCTVALGILDNLASEDRGRFVRQSFGMHSKLLAEAEKKIWEQAAAFQWATPIYADRVLAALEGANQVVQQLSSATNALPPLLKERVARYLARDCDALRKALFPNDAEAKSPVDGEALFKSVCGALNTCMNRGSFYRDFLSQAASTLIDRRHRSFEREFYPTSFYGYRYAGDSSEALAHSAASLRRITPESLKTLAEVLKHLAQNCEIWSRTFTGCESITLSALSKSTASQFVLASQQGTWTAAHVGPFKVEPQVLFQSAVIRGSHGSEFVTAVQEALEAMRRGLPASGTGIEVPPGAHLYRVAAIVNPGDRLDGAFAHSLGNLAHLLGEEHAAERLKGRIVCFDDGVPFNGTSSEARTAVVQAIKTYIESHGGRLWLIENKPGATRWEDAGFAAWQAKAGVLSERPVENEAQVELAAQAQLLARAHFTGEEIKAILPNAPTVQKQRPSFQEDEHCDLFSTQRNLKFVANLSREMHPELDDKNWQSPISRLREAAHSICSGYAGLPSEFDALHSDIPNRATRKWLSEGITIAAEVRASLKEAAARLEAVRANDRRSERGTRIHQHVEEARRLFKSLCEIAEPGGLWDEGGNRTAIYSLLEAKKDPSKLTTINSYFGELIDTMTRYVTELLAFDERIAFIRSKEHSIPSFSPDGTLRADFDIPLLNGSAHLSFKTGPGCTPALFVGPNSSGKTTTLRWLYYAHLCAVACEGFYPHAEVPDMAPIAIMGGDAAMQLRKLHEAFKKFEETNGGVLYLDEFMTEARFTQSLQNWLVPTCLERNIKLICNSNHPWSMVDSVLRHNGTILEVRVAPSGLREFANCDSLKYSTQDALVAALNAAARNLPAPVMTHARALVRLGGERR